MHKFLFYNKFNEAYNKLIIKQEFVR